MKRLLSITIIMAAGLLLQACSMVQCNEVSSTHITFLVDISDGRLFEAAKADIEHNLPGFMNKLGLSRIEPCQSLTVNIAPLSGREELNISTATIALDQKGLSNKEQRRRSNPKPILSMLNKSLSSFEQLKDDEAYNSGSSIGSQILKAMQLMQAADHSYVVVLSDMVQHDEHISMYRNIPGQVDEQVLHKLFSARLLKAFGYGSGQFNTGSELILVQYQTVDQSMKGKRREITDMWQKAFGVLNIQVQFIDNLSN